MLRRFRIKKSVSVTLAFLLLLLAPAEIIPASYTAAASDADSLSPEKEGSYKEGSVIVTLAAPSKTSLSKKGVASFDDDILVENSWDFGEADTLGSSEEQKKFLEDKTMYVSTVSSDIYSTEELVEKLEKKAYVVSVEPDYYQKKLSVTDDTFSDFQWYLDGTGTFSGSAKGIRYSEGKNLSSSKTPIIAVVDTGVDYTHEDLAARMWKNPYPSLPGVYGYDFGDNDSDPMDEDGHGTHCSGIIGAVSNNGKGIAGVSDSVRLMALKVFDASETITNSAIISAFHYIYNAQQLGANIAAVNCSWGGGPSASAMAELVKKIGDAGALFIFASGNDGKNQDTASRKECPYDLPDTYIVKVGASDQNELPASFSDYGTSSVELFAPGTDILSTVKETVFSPALYPQSLRNELCAYYSSCGDGKTILYTPTDIGISQPAATAIEYLGISHSTEDLFGNAKDGSFMVNINAPKRDSSTFFLYMDVTGLNLDTSKTHYISCDMGIREGDAVSWEHYSREISSSYFISRSGKSYVRLLGLSGSLSEIPAIYIDNPAISVDAPDAERFGKYSLMSGTSMAAPLVSGAAAVMAAHFTTDTAAQRKARLLLCTRKLPAFSMHCKTSGILDMSKISSSTLPQSSPLKNITGGNITGGNTAGGNPSGKILVKKIKLNKKKATLRYKKKLKLKATVTPKNATNKKITWSSSKKKYATVTKSGIVKAKKKGIGHTVKIYARAKDGSKKKAYCKVKIKKKK